MLHTILHSSKKEVLPKCLNYESCVFYQPALTYGFLLEKDVVKLNNK